jgi:hypothetical protein
MIVEFATANQESEKKSERVAAAWATKQAGKAEHGYGKKEGILTRIVPGWISSAGGKLALIPERAAIIRRIFEETAAGSGRASIVKRLNAEGVPTWGRGKRQANGWQPSYLAKILASDAVLGTLRTSHMGTAGAPIEGYYPAVIDRDLWQRAQAQRETAAGTKDRGEARVRNIAAGLARCPECEGTMTRIAKGKRSYPKLICSYAHRGGIGCRYVPVPMDLVQAAIVRLVDRPWPSKAAGLDDELKGAEAGLEGVLDQIDTIAGLLIAKPSAALRGRLDALEESRDLAQAEIDRLRRQAAETETRVLRRKEAQFRDVLTAQPLDVVRANAVLRDCMHKIVVDYDSGYLIVHWRHDGQTRIEYDPKFIKSGTGK